MDPKGPKQTAEQETTPAVRRSLALALPLAAVALWLRAPTIVVVAVAAVAAVAAVGARAVGMG